jgi:hypothetical protein
VGGTYGAADNGYALFDYSSGESGSLQLGSASSATLGDVLEPESPLMTGVASFAAQQAYRNIHPVSAGAIVVARWGGDDGQVPLVLRGTRGNRTLVELNFYPVSTARYSWSWTGDGAALLRNALKYSRCMPTVSKLACEPGTFAATGC